MWRTLWIIGLAGLINAGTVLPIELVKETAPIYEITFKHPGAKAVLLIEHIGQSGYRLELHKKSFNLYRISAGVERMLGRGKVQPGTRLVLRRRKWRISLEGGGRLLCEAVQSPSEGGGVFLRPAEVEKKLEFYYEKLSPARFEDDFMRTGEVKKLDPWTAKGGKWQLHSVVERHPKADVTRSSNPFSLGGKSEKPALAITGYSFWDDYTAGVSVKSAGGEVGLAFGVDQKQYYAVRWRIGDIRKLPSRLQLVKVSKNDGPSTVFEGSTEEVLAERWIAARKDQWYRIVVETLGRQTRVFVDDHQVFEKRMKEPVRGMVGVYVRGGEGFFDDVDIYSTDRVELSGRDLKSLRLAESGPWSISNGVLRSQHAILPVGTGEHRFSLDLKPHGLVVSSIIEGGKAGGFMFGYHNGQHIVFEVGGGRAELVKKGERETLIDSSSISAGDTHRLTADFREEEARLSVDGVVVFRAKLPTTGFGFYASGADVKFSRTVVSQDMKVDTEREPRNEIFRTDPYMQLWSSPVGVWFPSEFSERVFWHTGDFFGDYKFTFPCAVGTTLAFATEDEDFEGGYLLSVETGPRLVLKRLGKNVASAEIEKAPAQSQLWLSKEGRLILAGIDGEGPKELIRFRDDSPLEGRRVGFRSGGLAELPLVSVWRDKVMDCLFERAPADWEKVAVWLVTNRFACDPRWSHMSGQSKQGAILWSKYQFTGDQTLEFYAGMRMRTGIAMSYPRVGDINATICSDGSNVFSGYTFILQAWDELWSERWTRLLKNGNVVAETQTQLIPRVRGGFNWRAGRLVPMPWIAEGRAIHGAWYYIKIRKINGRLEYYVDNRLALVYRDPEPIEGGRFAIWTYDNAIMVARTRMSYENKTPVPLLEGSPPPASWKGLPSVPVVSKTHPGIFCPFDVSLNGWKSTDPQLGAYLELDRRTYADGESSLRLTNIETSGDFGAVVPIPQCDPRLIKRIQFDYKIPPSVKVNLYFLINGDWHFVQMTGPSKSDNLYIRIGKLPISADNKWHHASFDLYKAITAIYPWEKELKLTKVVIGYLHRGYEQVGRDGNPEGVSYNLDNFKALSASSAVPVFSWDYETLLFQYGLKGKPAHNLDSKQRSISFPEIAEGTYEFVLKAGSDEGETALSRVPFVYTKTPLAVESVSPPGGSAWGDELIVVKFRRDGGAELDTSSLLLQIDSETFPASLVAKFDPQSYSLSIDLWKTKLIFKNGDTLPLKLTYRRMLQQETNKLEWKYRVDYSHDRTPPRLVQVVGYRYDDFEDSLGEWVPGSGRREGIPVLDHSTSASGRTSLKVYKRTLAGHFRVRAFGGPVNIGRNPILAFDYRIGPMVFIDLALTLGSRQYYINFTDPDDNTPELGSIPVIADGKWHHAEINLRQLVSSQVFSPDVYNLNTLYFGDYSSTALPPGTEYHLDNFTLIPICSSRVDEKLELSATDPSGIKGFSYRWGKPKNHAPTKLLLTSPELVLRKLPEKELYLHIRAQDNASNWSECRDFRFIIDNTPPSFGTPVPAPRARAAPTVIKFPITDTLSGIDPGSVVFVLDNEERAPNQKFVKVKPDGLYWEWGADTGLFNRTVQDRTRVAVGIKRLLDFAGNPSGPHKWEWIVDYTEDKLPPPQPTVVSSSSNLLIFNDFSRSQPWRDWGGTYGGVVERVFDSKRNDFCLKLTNLRAYGCMGTIAYSGKYDLAKYPIVSFSYKITPNRYTSLLVYCNSKWFAIKVTVPSRSYRNVGAVPGIKADGNWHHASVNVYELIRRTIPRAKSYNVRLVCFADYYRRANPAGAVIYFDNFTITGTGPPEGLLKVTSFDPTGIAGYSFVADTDPETEPDTKVDSTDGTLKLNLRSGLNYIHIKAVDGAGNWSATTHFPYLVP